MEYTELQNIAVEVTFERWAKFNGIYSDVHIGQFRNEKVAVKIIRSIGHTSPETMQRKMRRERKLWVKLKHRNIAPFYGFAEDERFGPLGALISPWYENGDAAKFLKVYGKKMDILARSTLWMGVIAGVHYLHTCSPVIVHGDLKPGNILIDDQWNARLCDFGISRMLTAPGASGLTTTSAHAGTERYLSYELVVSDEACSPTTASDIYALACIGFEFIYLQPPYASRQIYPRRDIEKRLPPAVRSSTLSGLLIPLWDVFESCWVLEAAMRPDTEHVLTSHKQWHASYAQELEQKGHDANQDGLSSLTAGATDTKTWIGATRLSFQIIEPWADAKSELATTIITPLRREAKAFSKYLHHSYLNAQSGYSFAKTAEGLCDLLLDPNGTYSDDVINCHIKEMLEITTKAHEGTTIAANMFQTNIQDFDTITAKIPAVLETIGYERTHMEARCSRATRRAEGWERIFSRFIMGNQGRSTSTQVPLQVDGAFISLLPVTIPLALIATSGAKVFFTQAKERQQQLIRYGVAIDTLTTTVENLQELMEHMDVLAAYWVKMNTTLGDIKCRIGDLHNDRLLQLKIQDLKEDWKKVGSEYFHYKQDLSKLGNYSPMYRRAIASTSAS